MSKLLFSMLGAFSEFERALIKERQKEGIILAKKRGSYKGRKQLLTTEQVESIKMRVAEGHKKNCIAKDLIFIDQRFINILVCLMREVIKLLNYE